MSYLTKSISSDIKTLRSIFKNDSIFKIPDFQRDFVWSKDEVNKLFDDFSEDTNDFRDISGEGYLLGNIVTIQTTENNRLVKEVIDGQQRLTVLSLLFYALNRQIEDLKRETAVQFQNGEITNDEMIAQLELWSSVGSELDMAYSLIPRETGPLKIQHDPSLLIGEHYKDFFKESQSNDSTKDNETKIETVYSVIEEQVQQITNSDDDKQKIKNFINYLKDHVYLIETSAISLSKAFQLFEVLNQRGVGLTPLDLIKNLLLKRLTYVKGQDKGERERVIESRRKRFGELWYDFVSMLELKEDLRFKPINSSTFLKHYLIGKDGKKLTDKKLFDYFSDIRPTPKEVLDLVEDFTNVLVVYRELELKNYDRFTNDGHSKLVLQLIFESFSNKQAHSLLIPFYDKDEKLKAKVLNYAVRLVAAINYAEGSPSALETIIAQANNKLYSRDEDNELNLDSFFTYLQSKIEGNSERAKAVVEVNKYANRLGNPNNKSKYLFKFIEVVAHNENPFSQRGTTRGRRTITLEHIMPQTLNESLYEHYGINSEFEHKDYLNRIGNLAIIEKPENSAMKNKPYKYKKDFFAETIYYTTKSLADEIRPLTRSGHKYEIMNTANDYLFEKSFITKNYWDIEAINERSKKIAKYLHYVLINVKS